MMKGNKIMKMKFANSELEYELLDGEYRRYTEEEYGEYLCVGVLNTNRILFQYIDTKKESINFVQSIINNIHDLAIDYLVNVLEKNDDLLVRLTLYPEAPTSFEIYYNCDCEEDDTNSLIKWISTHNDFAAKHYRYTEIKNGHQKYIGEE